MKIKYLGHSAFVITSNKGVKIITDPYAPGPDLTYGEITESADVVTVSHGHHDHNNVAAVRGNPEVANRAGRSEVKGIEFRGIASYHDDTGGKRAGNNLIICFEMDGVRVCHLGDLGHRLDDKQLKEIGRVDVLFVPVGGLYTIDAKVATEVCNQLKPRVIIPIHYKTEKGLPNIAGVDEFLRGKANVSRPDSSQAEFKPGELPATGQIIVLKTAL
ncbi:MAG: MBL fold metallo-hydrolase [Deltaproteobacteria bacterium]|nr:MBL fold metallo-hydrolase [Deltaproteobacteria bacterium]